MAQSSKNSALTVACMLGLVTPGALCAEWTANAGVSPQVVYTDNVCLSADDKESDVYGIVTPNVSISGSGNRANVSLSTSVDLNSLTDSSLEKSGCGAVSEDRDRYSPNLNASADAVLIDNWLFIDAGMSVSQNEVNPFAAGGGDAQDRTGNTNTTAQYTISPYITRRFKDVAALNLRYTYDDQFNSKDVVGDSSQESVQFTLDNSPRRSSFSIGLQGDYSNVSYSDSDARGDADSELSSVQVNLGMQVSRQWNINGYFGNDTNDFVSTFDETDGGFWSAGVTWTPNSRTNVSVGTGDRFYDDTPYFSISHYYRRSAFTADYAKTITYSRNIRNLDGGVGESGQPTTISASPILDERFDLGYSYQGRRNTLGVGASWSEQTRTLDGSDSTFVNVSVSMSRPLSRTLSLSGGVNWGKDKPGETQNEFFVESETWTATLDVSRPISASTNVSLNYQYTDRRSDLATSEYTENRVSLRISFSL